MADGIDDDAFRLGYTVSGQGFKAFDVLKQFDQEALGMADYASIHFYFDYMDLQGESLRNTKDPSDPRNSSSMNDLDRYIFRLNRP